MRERGAFIHERINGLQKMIFLKGPERGAVLVKKKKRWGLKKYRIKKVQIPETGLPPRGGLERGFDSQIWGGEKWGKPPK